LPRTTNEAVHRDCTKDLNTFFKEQFRGTREFSMTHQLASCIIPVQAFKH